MYELMLTLHVVLAIFAIGPLVHAATTASRGLRHGDAAAIASSARTLRVYGVASVLVVVAGFGLMSADLPYGPPGQKAGEFGDLWIWLSLLLWAVATAVVFALLVPALTKASAGGSDARAATGKVAAGGGIVALAFVVVVVLMVYRPGS